MLRQVLALCIEDAGHNVMIGRSYKDGIKLLKFASADVLVTGIILGDADGTTLVSQAIEMGMPSVLISATSGSLGVPTTQNPPSEQPFPIADFRRKLDEAAQFSQRRTRDSK